MFKDVSLSPAVYNHPGFARLVRRLSDQVFILDALASEL
jgi:hypothetical protein